MWQLFHGTEEMNNAKQCDRVCRPMPIISASVDVILKTEENIRRGKIQFKAPQ